MKISKTRLKEIIKEEVSMLAERSATVPQVQQMAAAAGVRLSYGDAKTLAAQTPAERSALIQLQRALKDGSWERMREELSEMDLPKWEGEPFGEYDLDAENERGRLGDLQSDEKFTGGSPEERLLTLMRAREVLAKMSEEDLEELSLSLDGETTRWLQHLLANPMYRE